MNVKQNILAAQSEPGFDLITAVGDLLTEAGLHKEVLAFYYTNKWIVEAKAFQAEGQRFLLNRYWNQQLLNVESINTIPQRASLIPNGEIKDWLRIFEGVILPVCIEHNLPVQL